MILTSKGLAILTGTGGLHLGGMTEWLIYPQSVKREAIHYIYRNLEFRSLLL